MKDKETLEEELILLGVRLGRKPTKYDLKENGLPSANTFRRYGISLNNDLAEKIYYRKPKNCLYCFCVIPFGKGNIFCSSSCSAKHNNTKRGRQFSNKENLNVEKPCVTCRNCDTIIKDSRIYCSQSCCKDYQYKEKIAQWKDGVHKGYTGKTLSLSKWLRKYLRETRGTACSKCGWDEKHPDDGSVLTEIDHVDGDASNNNEDNLRILCPNCHSMTSTFRARNKDSQRER